MVLYMATIITNTLSADADGVVRLHQSGVIPELLLILESDSNELVELALGILRKLASDETGANKVAAADACKPLCSLLVHPQQEVGGGLICWMLALIRTFDVRCCSSW